MCVMMDLVFDGAYVQDSGGTHIRSYVDGGVPSSIEFMPGTLRKAKRLLKFECFRPKFHVRCPHLINVRMEYSANAATSFNRENSFSGNGSIQAK